MIVKPRNADDLSQKSRACDTYRDKYLARNSAALW